MYDYARMVDGKARLPTDSGEVTIEHVRYTFTSPEGSKANVQTIRDAFNDAELANRIDFELFTPDGKRVAVQNETQLDLQKWLFK